MNEAMNDCCEARQSQTGEQFDRLQNQIERMEHLQDALRQKLTSVLRSEPACKGEGKEPDQNLVPLADHVRSLWKRTGRIADGFEEILGALEL